MYYIEKYGRYFAVMKDSQLICVCVYRKGARAVIDLLTANQPPAMAVFFHHIYESYRFSKKFSLRGRIRAYQPPGPRRGSGVLPSVQPITPCVFFNLVSYSMHVWQHGIF